MNVNLSKRDSSLSRLSTDQDEAGSHCARSLAYVSSVPAGCKVPGAASKGPCAPHTRNPEECGSLPAPGWPYRKVKPAHSGTGIELSEMPRVQVTQTKRSSTDPTLVSAATIDPHLNPIVVHLAHVGVPFERPGGHDLETRPPFTLSGQVYGCSVRILVDSGATCNFISESLVGEAASRGKPIKVTTSGRRMSLTLGDGSARECNQVAADVPVHMGFGPQSLQERLTFRVTQLMPEYDIILGTPWLHRENPDIDWQTGAMEIKRTGGRAPVVLQGLAPPASQQAVEIESAPSAAQCDKPVEFISAHQLKQEQDSGELVYMCFIQVTTGDVCSLATVVLDRNLHATEYTPARSGPEAAFVRDYADLFVAPTGLPPLRHINHEIDLVPGAKAPYRPAYRLAQSELDELRKQIDKLIALGHVRPSRSSFGAPVLFVSKKNGEKRMCVDYRDLNKICVRNSVAMPRADDLMDRMHGKRVFSTLDMVAAFHQVRIRPGDEHKTGFNTRLGHYEFLVTPFGMINSPATLQMLLADIFREYIDDFMVIYLDDMLVFSDNEEDHARHLELIAAVLRKHDLRLSLKKCRFYQSRVEFLGHLVGQEGISMDPRKVEAIREWPVPTTVTHVKQFLGLASFYRRFIDKFSFISTVLSNLTKKEVVWEWGAAEQAAFEGLKDAMTQAPVLAIADSVKGFTLHTDASNFAIAGVLSQEQPDGTMRPVAFQSRKLVPAEINYPTHDKELLAIVHSLKVWKHYCLGRPVNVFTDHASLRYFLTQKDLTGRQGRWAESLAQYTLEIKYLPGIANVVADALSRRPDFELSATAVPVSLTAISAVQVSLNIRERIINACPQDEALQAHRIKQPDLFKVSSDDNAVYYTQGGLERLYVPFDIALYQDLLEEHHDASGHMGVTKTLHSVARYFYWPRMIDSIRDYIAGCVECQRNKSSSRKPMGLLHPLQIPEARWQSISLDFMMPLPKTKDGFDGILVIVDRLSKMMHCFPVHTTITGAGVAKLYLDNIFRHHGMPQDVVSDRDPRFTGVFWRELWRLLGTRLAMSVSNHPQTDGQTERANRTLQDILRAMVNDNQSDWDQHLIKAEFAYNNSVQASTGHTPFYLNYGQHPRMPMTSVAEGATRVPAVLEMLSELRTGLTKTKENIKKSQERQSRVANQHRRPHEFIIGDLVWLFADNINRPDVQCNKFAAKFEGPFPITALIGDTSVRLKLPVSWHINDSFHVSMLKKYVGNDVSAFTGRGMPPPPPALDEAEDLWEVERCLQKRRNRQQVLVLVKWLGHPRCENTWIPLSRLNNMAKEEADALPFNGPTRAQRGRLQQEESPPPSAQPPEHEESTTPQDQDQDQDQVQVQEPSSARRSTRMRVPTRPRD